MYTNQITTLLNSKLRLEIICQLLAVTSEFLVYTNNVNIKVRVDGADEFEVNEIKSKKRLGTKFMIFC